MNPDLDKLQPYPFERLGALKSGLTPSDKPAIALSIGEPKHDTPSLIGEALQGALATGLARYPTTRGTLALRETITQWLTRRYHLPSGSLDPERHALPVAGTREALFAFAQATIDRKPGARVLMPNPFYQIYEGAALLAGASPQFLACTRENGYQPNFDHISSKDWNACQLLYVCSPGNPSGAVLSEATLRRLIELAETHDFIIAADECYAEIYLDEQQPPVGLLQACAAMGNTDYRRCVVFHSLSKRSNAPGLRSGFIAGDAMLIESFLRYRTYHGCAMPLHHQQASIAAWRDERHVIENRRLYREKFDAVLGVLQTRLTVQRPAAGFYLWPETPIDDEQFTRRLLVEENVSVLPGSYLSRTVDGHNPGANHVRMALVATQEECLEAAQRINNFLNTL